MSMFVLLLLMVLCAYRIWRLLAEDAFPPAIWFREWSDAAVARRFGGTWAAGIRCPWCSGFWISAAVVAAVWAYRPLPLPGLWFGAVSTAVGLLAQRDDG